MDKVVKTILDLKETMHADWSDALAQIDIYDPVSALYDTYDTYHANLLLCFLVLSCHQDSGYLDRKKDRIDDKKRIMVSLAGPSCLSDPLISQVVFEIPGGPVAQVMDWLFDYQMDARLKARDALDTYSSIALSKVAQINSENDPKTMKEVGQLIDVALSARERADALDKKIKEDFAALEDMATQDGRKSPTQRHKGIDSWENHIMEKKQPATE